MERGVWYRIDVIISGPAPGEQAILVNGFTGRNAAKLAPGSELRTGDYAHLPQLSLVTPLPERQLGSDDFNPYFPAIEVQGNPISDAVASRSGKSVASYLLPSSGIIRIGTEYISYSSINGNTLQNCYRGRRVGAFPTFQPPSEEDLEKEPDLSEQDFPEIRTPISEAHAAGDPVLPGDFRRSRDSETNLFIGHNFLGADFGNGDPNEERPDGEPNQNQWRHWGALSLNAADYPPSHQEENTANNGSMTLVIDQDTTEIICESGWVEPSVWPSRGIIRVGSGWNRQQFFHYTRFDGRRFSGLTFIPRQRSFTSRATGQKATESTSASMIQKPGIRISPIASVLVPKAKASGLGQRCI